MKDYKFTWAWAVFPEYTQWENRSHKLHWDDIHDLNDVADYAVEYSHRKPTKWERPMAFGDFVQVRNSASPHSEWLKMVPCECCDARYGHYEWEVSSWEEVFGEECRTRKEIDKMLENL